MTNGDENPSDSAEPIRVPVVLEVASDRPGPTSRAPAPADLYHGKFTKRQLSVYETSKCQPIIVIDADFDSLHASEGLMKSLAQQIMYSYHSINASSQPCLLYVCGISAQLWDRLKRTQAVFWTGYLTHLTIQELLRINARVAAGEKDAVPTATEDPLLKRMPLEFCYLSADAVPIVADVKPEADGGRKRAAAESHTPPSEPEAGMPGEIIPVTNHSAFIVGGLIDRNLYKGHCLQKAETLGVKAAQLPIREYLADACAANELAGSRVLTINQVVAMLQTRFENQSWSAACVAHLPTRKIRKNDELEGTPPS